MIAFIKRHSTNREIAGFILGPILGIFLVYPLCVLGDESELGVIFVFALCLTSPHFAWALVLSIFWKGDSWTKILLIGLSATLFLISLCSILGPIVWFFLIKGPINPG